MNLDLRQAVLQNIKDKSEDQLKNMVESAIEEHEEKTLPGLGVLFEVMWQNLDGNVQNQLIKTLSKNI